ncbi:TonB-dependent siderophore receptor [Pseudorhodoferax sp. Leaf267]|uniref:TonB-dependent siderophore receptor n=1 Tax=Pseudorhodoferax sp. Leaf267 TaxID=1736316 RepID=UPI0006F26380|nr:TonB-dependent siderophore receptor [Pseudorhodoferax sp. Leaf267]KQP12861.1 TonB-dependent receptor [Pseudorhodoferax sp. Leaf267]
MHRTTLHPVAAAAAVLLTTLQGAAWAQATPTTATTPATTAGTLSEIRVNASAERETATSPVVGYRARRAATATKTDTPLAETPQSVTVVTRDQLVDQGATNLQDALAYAAGVRSDGYGLDSRADSVMIRGTEPSIYLDGLQQNSAGWYTSTTRPDPYVMERIEVLRGPAGMLFGAGTAAGVVNMVSKRPLQDAQREVGVQFGSHGRKQVQADLTGPLSDQWSYRIVALHRKADTQVDYVPDDRTLIAPSLAWRPDGATSLVLQGFWQKDKTGSTSQFFPWQGTLLPNPNGRLPTSRFIGEPGDGYDSDRKSFGWQFEHRFNDQWTLRQNLRISRNENDSDYFYANFFGNGVDAGPGGWSVDPINQRLIERYYGRSITRTRMTGVDTHAEGHLQTGAVRHTLLAGLDYSRQREHKREGASQTSVIDAYAPVYGVNLPDRGNLVGTPGTTQRNVGVYLQDQMQLDRWIVVAGLRHDRATAGTDGSDDETTSATTKRLGLMYTLPAGWSPYVSYTESFTPLSGRMASGGLFKPLRGEQVEAGVKYMPEGASTSVTASVYKLKEKNRTISDPTDPRVGLQLDATRNKGVELELKTSVGRRTDLIAHFNYTDADDKLGGMPRRQAAVWAKQGFAIADLAGFSVGAGVRFMSSFSDRSEAAPGPRVPSVTLLDLVLAYDTDAWRFALNVNNAADKVYVSTCLARGDCWWGARRTVVASATYRF